MIHNATNVNGQSGVLARRIAEAEQGFNRLMDFLPSDIKPCPFVGFDISEPTENTSPLLGWSYDWSDKGDNPPPWSDWSDKEE